MSGLTSRNKGKRGEREIVHLLQPVIDEVYASSGIQIPILQRNTIQSDRGGFDIVGLDWLAIEVKHQEQNNVNGWWKQTVQQAGKKMPVLFYRRNNAAWRVRTTGVIHHTTCNAAYACCVVDIAVDDFLIYFRNRLLEELVPEMALAK